MDAEQGGAGGRRSRLPVMLMAAGLVAGALAVTYQVRSSDRGTPAPAAAPAAATRADGEAGGAAAPPGTGRSCQASDDPRPIRGYEAPSVVVDPADPDHMVVGDVNLIAARCTWHVTFDGGRTWEDGEFEVPPGFQDCGLDSGGYIPMSNLTIGPSGALYAVLSAEGGAGTEGPRQGESLLLARSTDGGRTFSTPRVVIPGGTTDDAWLRPLVTAVAGAGGRDRLLVSFWDCQPRLCNRAMFAQSSDGGDTFSRPVVVSPDPGGNSPSAPVITADGAIYLTYLQRVQGSDTAVLLARSNDGGLTFSARSFDAQPDVGLQYDNARLVAAPGGDALYTVFSHKGKGTDQVFFRRSLDRGDTWEEEVRVNSRVQGASFGPDMSVAPNGRIDVVFFSQRVADREDVLWASSTDGGRTFGKDRQLNDKTIDRRIGYRQEIVSHYRPNIWSTDAGPVAVWSDTARGDKSTDTQDTHLRRIRVTAAPGAGG